MVKFITLAFISVTMYATADCRIDSSRVNIKKNHITLAWGGKGNTGSINFGHTFSSSRKWHWEYNIGIAPFEISDHFSFPFSLNTFTRGKLHHFEIDLRNTLYFTKYHPYTGGVKNDYNLQLFLNPSIGYRLQGATGLMLKTGVGPQFLIDPPSDNIARARTRFLKPVAFITFGYQI